MTYNADTYWETVAAVIPVLAFAFVVEVRFIQFHRLSPFDRLFFAFSHAFTICIMVFGELASLFHLVGYRQARWMEQITLYGIGASLIIILMTPAMRLIFLGLYSNSPRDYVDYWKSSRKLHSVNRDLRSWNRQLLKAKQLFKKIDASISQWETKAAAASVSDLKSAWKQAELLSLVEQLKSDRRVLTKQVTEATEQIARSKRRARKLKKQLVNSNGRRAKRIMKVMAEMSESNQNHL